MAARYRFIPLAPEEKSGRTSCIPPHLLSVHIFAPANASAGPCGYITKNSCSIGKHLNLTYYNHSGRTIPPFLTQLQLEQLQTNTNAIDESNGVHISPLLLKFTMNSYRYQA